MTKGANKAIQTKGKRRYFLPTAGRVVEAEDIKTAVAQVEEAEGKASDGDIKSTNTKTS